MKNKLSMKERVMLADWIRYPNRTNNKTAAELSKEASSDLGFTITPHQIIYLCQELDIQWEKGTKSNRIEMNALNARVDELEAKINELQNTVKILKGFYINTTTKPRKISEQKQINQETHQ